MEDYIKSALVSSCILYSENKISESVFLDVIKSLLIQSYKPDLSKYPSGSATPSTPDPPKDRLIREDGKGLVKPNNWEK